MSQPRPGKPGNPKNPIAPKKPLIPGTPHGDPRPIKGKITNGEKPYPMPIVGDDMVFPNSKYSAIKKTKQVNSIYKTY
jgi:hypothetical protein